MERRRFIKATAAGATGFGLSAATQLGSLGALGALGSLLPTDARAADTLKVAAMLPLSGPTGLFGPSARNCCELARDDVNARGGILGRKLEVLFGDAGAGPEAATQTALKLWKGSGAEVVVGMHDGATRDALITLFRGQIPYFFSPTTEGGECAPGVYLNGETPDQQLAPAIPYLAAQRNLKRWYLIGNDYNWPRGVNAVGKKYIAAAGGTVVGEEYLPFSVDNFDANLSKIRSSGADAVLITLVGGASVTFNRAFAGVGLSSSVTRFGGLLEENTIAGIGAQNSEGLYTALGFFAGMKTAPAQAFEARYHTHFPGNKALMNGLAESCYEGFLMFEAVAKRAGIISVPKFEAASEGANYNGPRGMIEMHARHVAQDIHLVRIGGPGFELVKTFPHVASGQTCKI